MTPTPTPLPEPIDLGPQGQDIAGQRFGELTALHPVRKSAAGNRWLFACDCGGLAERPLAAVRHALKRGTNPQCARCLAEQTAGFWIARNARTRTRYAALFAKTGRLWTRTSLERLEREVAEALDQAGWDAPREAVPHTLPIAAYGLGDAIDFRKTAETMLPTPARAERRLTRARNARARRQRIADLNLQAERDAREERERAEIAIAMARTAAERHRAKLAIDYFRSLETK